MEWRSYGRLDRVKGLRNEGRELLGHEVIFTEKRDGENVAIWQKFGEPIGDTQISIFKVSSHNLEDASEDIKSRLYHTPEWVRATELLSNESVQYKHNYILFGELLKTIGPTRIEPKRKHTHWVLFDVWDGSKFLDYTLIYQLGKHYRIPVVRALHSFVPTTLEQTTEAVKTWLSWCKRHRREGIVGKSYFTEPQTFFKEKIDIPELERIRPTQQDKPQLPPMPEERILRALQHALDEVGLENWKDVRKAMPIVAKHLVVEGKEHNFEPPRNYFSVYQNTPLEKIQNGAHDSHP